MEALLRLQRANLREDGTFIALQTHLSPGMIQNYTNELIRREYRKFV